MLAVDTNILIRLLTNDDAAQSAVAKSLFASQQIWIAKTVLLEAAWVLETVYEFDEAEIAGGLMKLISLGNVVVEDESAMRRALALVEQGVEIADAIHLFSRPPEAQFVSFDKAGKTAVYQKR